MKYIIIFTFLLTACSCNNYVPNDKESDISSDSTVIGDPHGGEWITVDTLHFWYSSSLEEHRRRTGNREITYAIIDNDTIRYSFADRDRHTTVMKRPDTLYLGKGVFYKLKY